MEKTADIYINIPVKSIAKPYTYLVPEQFDFLKAGCRVLVPFGGRLMEGFIIKIHDTSADLDTARLKAVKDVLDTQPWFTPNMYATAKWMADFYLCSLGETMRLFIPGKNSVKIRPVFNINETDLSAKKLAKLPAGQKQLLAYLKAYKNADLLTLRRSFGAGENFTADLEKLIAKNYVTRSYIYHSQAKKIYVEYAVLNAAVDETVLDTLKRKPAQKKALLYLNEIKESSAYDLKQRGISAATLNALAELGYIRLEKRQKLRDSYKNMLTAKAAKRTLTPEQQNALNIMKEKIGQGQKKFLLFGVTGSGKTQIYIETALKEVDPGVVQAARAMGSTNFQIIVKVLLPEALPSLVSGVTLTIINLIGYSAMAGAIGGGGLGDLAIRYGYQRFRPEVMVAAVVIILLLVEIIQLVGSRLSAAMLARR